MKPVPLIVQGVGALGRRFVSTVCSDRRFALLGAIDHDPALAGHSLGDVLEDPAAAELPIEADLAALLDRLPTRPSVLVQMTESRPERIRDSLLAATDARLSVLCAAESMFYPWLRYPKIAAEIDAAAREREVTVSGTGINPGYIFDQLVIDAAAATTGIEHVALNRIVEVGDTGPGDIEHVGFGLAADQFRRQVAAGAVEGHMGLPESFVLLAEYLDLPIDRIVESWEPVTAKRPMPSAIGEIPPGHVVGIVQGATATHAGQEIMTARLAMYYDAQPFEKPKDSIVLTGRHTIRLSLEPAAVSILGAAQVMANTVVALTQAEPGLVCAVDLPAARTRRGPRRYQAASSSPGRIDLVDRGAS